MAYPNEPAEEEHTASTPKIREPAHEQIESRLRDSKCCDKCDRRSFRGNPKFRLSDQGENGAFEADHPPDKCIDKNEKSKL